MVELQILKETEIREHLVPGERLPKLSVSVTPEVFVDFVVREDGSKYAGVSLVVRRVDKGAKFRSQKEIRQRIHLVDADANVLFDDRRGIGSLVKKGGRGRIGL